MNPLIRSCRTWLACLALAWSGPVSRGNAGDSVVRNGEFDSPGEEGWSYEGRGDGSHGVYSEPTRPGSRAYLLQLRGDGGPGQASIRQTVRVTPGATYLATVEFRFCGPQDGTEGIEDAFSGKLEGVSWFREPLAGPRSEEGRKTSSARFRAMGPEVDLRLELQGIRTSREASTVAVESVCLREVPGTGFSPYEAGYRLVPEREAAAVTVGWSFGPEETRRGGFEVLERIRATTGQSAAWLPWNYTWDFGTTPEFPFQEFRAEAEAWGRSGVVPVLTLRGPAPLDLPVDGWEGSMRGLARALRDWGYPVVLRPWPDMERRHKSGAAGEFVGVWRKARGWFVAEGAGHVSWWWTPDAFGEESDAFYPGDGHVDYVGCPDGAGDLAGIYAAYALRYRRKPLAVPEGRPVAEAPELTGFAKMRTEHYPRLEVYCFTGAWDRFGDAGWARSFRDGGWDRGSPHARFRVPQRTPPRPMAVVGWDERGWRAVVTNLGDEHAASVAEYVCQFHDGDPADGGMPVGRPRTLRMRRGEERTIRDPSLSGDGEGPWLRITVRPGSEALRGSAAPDAVIRDFRPGPRDRG